MDAPSTVSEATAYGGFTLGAMDLALPMSALREVVPCQHLIRLPCPAACVVGGIDLRGVMLPVVDLRILLGDAPAGDQPGVVIVMVLGARLLGLLAHGVTGIFTAAAGSLKRQHASDASVSVFAASIRRESDGKLLSLLSPDDLASLRQVPMVDDPEPARQQVLNRGATVIAESEARSVMLFRCGRVLMAIDAMTVQAALAAPQISNSVLAIGHCRGVIDHARSRVPVVDLQALCGFGALGSAESLQCFIVRLEAGMVGLLVNEVIDVVRILPRDTIALSALALTDSDIFTGAVPASALPEELVMRTGLAAAHFLMIDGDALRASPVLVALSHTNTASDPLPGGEVAATAEARSTRRAMVTFELCSETATPIEQLAEILPYRAESNVFAGGWPMAGLIVDRGRSIPVMSLCGLMGGGPEEQRDTAVLVVQEDGQWMGFSVPRLCTIESAQWEPVLPVRRRGGESPSTQVLRSGQLAVFGSGASERSIRVLDLNRLASTLLVERSVQRTIKA